MTYFAKVTDGVVVDVIVAELDFFENFKDSSPGFWLETSKSGHIRKNYAGIGHTYDSKRDAFIAKQDFPSWILNEDTCQWEAPKPYPGDGGVGSFPNYDWNEATMSWVEHL
jgi:hypothetical protein